MRARRVPLLLAVAAVPLLAGCGSLGTDALPPAAAGTPAPTGLPPAATATPVGSVWHVGAPVRDLVADPRTHVVALTLGDGTLVLRRGSDGRRIARVRLHAGADRLGLTGAGGPVLVQAGGALRAFTLPAGRPVAPVVHTATHIDQRLAGLDAVVQPRARRVVLRDPATGRIVDSTPAGVSPVAVACRDAGPCYVADPVGTGVLVVARRAAGLKVVRWLYLPGGAAHLAIDPIHERIYATLPDRNEVVQLPATGRPHVLKRWPSVRGAGPVAVDGRTQRVYVAGHGGAVQAFDATSG